MSSLYEWAGGRDALVRLVDAFYDRVESDDRCPASSDPEFRSAFMAYVESGTRLALHNSQPGADVAEHAPVPRWGWGEAPPYVPWMIVVCERMSLLLPGCRARVYGRALQRSRGLRHADTASTGGESTA
jgi:hypothetical protein